MKRCHCARRVDGLGHDQVRAGLELAGQALELALEVRGRGVEGAGDGEAGRRADGLARPGPRPG